MMDPVYGKAFICKDAVTVYEIISEVHWTMKKLDPEAMGNWVFETLEPGCEGVPGAFKEKGYGIVVAGETFGCGSKSVEHPMAALKGAGIQLIIAESVSRYSYRNAINLALPVLICPGISSRVRKGDLLKANLYSGLVRNETRNESYEAQGLGEFAMRIIERGGLREYIRGGL